MPRLVLDAGGLIALERRDDHAWIRFRAHAATDGAATHGGVVAQVYRTGGDKQAMLSKALAGIEVVSLDEALGRQAGRLLALSGLDDAIDAAVVAMARDGDIILTSDPIDIGTLVDAAAISASVIRA